MNDLGVIRMRKRESADSCTTILVENASYDGSTIVARTEDSQMAFLPRNWSVKLEDQLCHKSVLSTFEIDLPG